MARNTDQWLWRISEELEEQPVEAIEDAELLAYRDGGLAEAQRERIEWALTRSAATRARLIALAGGVEDRSAGALRERVLGLEARPRRSRVRWQLAAAAILVLAIGLPLALWWSDSPLDPAAFDRVAFDVRVEGISDVRTVPEGDNAVPRAQPESWLSIFVEPDGEVSDRIGFALYRLENERLERLGSADVEVEIARGAARLRARAGALVGSSPGTRTFYVVVSERSPLPSSVDAVGGDPAGSLERATAGKIYPRSIRIEGALP